MKYDQFLAVMLTALGVMLAAVTLLVGLVAVFGYQFLRDEAQKKAADVAKKAYSETMRETRERAQATGMSEGQAEDFVPSDPVASEGKSGATLAISDKGLERE